MFSDLCFNNSKHSMCPILPLSLNSPHSPTAICVYPSYLSPIIIHSSAPFLTCSVPFNFADFWHYSKLIYSHVRLRHRICKSARICSMCLSRSGFFSSVQCPFHFSNFLSSESHLSAFWHVWELSYVRESLILHFWLSRPCVSLTSFWQKVNLRAN